MDIPIDDAWFSYNFLQGNNADFDYPGIRIMIEARIDKLRQTIKIDISTDDVITLGDEYEYS